MGAAALRGRGRGVGLRSHRLGLCSLGPILPGPAAFSHTLALGGAA